ncbi:PE family protein [Mycobacterium palustre]|nr:PE family protein [Mycobacterium palustre]
MEVDYRSFLVAVPDAVATAAESLAGIASSLSVANSAAAVSTTGLLAAANDEVSTAIAALFSGHAAEYQAMSAQAAAFHAQFVQAQLGAGGAYAATEAANASPVQTLAQEVLGADQHPDPAAGSPADRQRGQRGPGYRGERRRRRLADRQRRQRGPGYRGERRGWRPGWPRRGVRHSGGGRKSIAHGTTD